MLCILQKGGGVQIRPTKTKDESKVLRAAKQSDKFAIALVLAGFIGFAGWFVVPKEIKEKITPIALAGFGGVGFVFRIKLLQIRDGRLAVGDIDEGFINYALMRPEDEARFAAVADYVSGDKPLGDLPAIRNTVDAAVGEKVSAHVENFERVARARESLIRSEIQPTAEPQRVLDPAWEAPV